MLSKLKFPFAACLLFFALSINVFAQQSPPASSTPVAASPEAQLLRALLDEVRQLRATIQRTNLSLHRAQMLTERLARQQNRVDGLAEEIEQVRIQIRQSVDPSRDEEELKEMEAEIGQTADPQTRAQLTQSYNDLKRTIARQRELARAEADRQQVRQAQLENTLRTEQAKLAEIQDQLDAIDREFDKQAGEGRKTR